MTPMIDIIFQLIIFFLAVNQFQKAETDRTVNLPKASEDHVEPDVSPSQSRVILNLRTDEEITAAGRVIPPGEIGEFLRMQKRGIGAGTLEVWIRADREVNFGRVEPILLACADAGIWKVAFKVVTLDVPERPDRGQRP